MQGHIDLGELLRDAQEQIARKMLKRANPYVVYLIAALLRHAEGLERQHVISAVEKMRRDKGLPIPKKFEETVQRAFESHAAGYAGSSDDLFYSVGGKGSGIWAVNLIRADAWLTAKMEAGVLGQSHA